MGVPKPKPSPARPDRENEALPSPSTRSDQGFECFNDPHTMDHDLTSMLFDDEASGSQTPETDLVFPNAGCADLAFTHPSPAVLALPPADLGVDPAFLLPPPPPFDISNRTPHSLVGTGNMLARLSRLNESIALQLSWMDGFVVSAPPSHLARACVDQASDPAVNPILRALESTSELAALIRQVVSPVRDHMDAPLNLPVILMSLSAHLQLLHIYNAIFMHVYRFLGGIDDVAGFFEGLPGFTHMAGLPTIKGDLYIKIIVQVAEHAIGGVEGGIGLPAELCLSQRGTRSRSLLSGVESPGVVQSIMEQACSQDMSGRVLVETLRARIGNVLGLLRDG